MDIKPGVQYLLEAYIKTENLTTNNGIFLEAYQDWSDVLGSTARLTGTNDWTYVSRVITPRSYSTKINFRFRRFSGGGAISGTAWVDHIKVTALNVDITPAVVNPVSNGFNYTFPPHSFTALEISGAADSDSDSMSDAFEILYNLNPNNNADAAIDSDGDGLTNLQEYQAGTSPTNPDSDSDNIADGADACPLNPPVKISGTSQHFSTLQAAYSNAISLDVIKGQAGLISESLIFDVYKDVTLDGGYDCAHSVKTGQTTLNGDIVIINGTVTIGDLSLQ